MKPSFVFVLIVAGLTIVPGASRSVFAQVAGELPPVQQGSHRETLRELARSSGNPGIGDVLATLTALEIATAPLGSPAGGFVFRYDDDLEMSVRQAPTFGPLLIDRALTTGRGTVSVGLSVASANYESVSEFPLDNLPVATFEGPAPIVSSSTLSLDLQSLTTTVVGSLGITDSLDLGVVVPFVGVTLQGSQLQQEAVVGSVIFRGTSSAVGLGDIGIVGKYGVWASQDRRSGVAALVTLRVPTGDADNLRGVDVWRTLLSGAASAGFGRLSVHATGGYEFWNGSVPLSNTLPENVVETWSLAGQTLYGAAFEFEAHSALTVSVEVVGRRLHDAGRIGIRSVPVLVPELGIESVQLMGVGPESLQETIVVPVVKWNIGEELILSFGGLMSLDDTGLRDPFVPILGFSWAMCSEC